MSSPSGLDGLAAVPSVTIVVPAHNHARYLPRALDSLLRQDHAKLEIIVVDDGSTDETPLLRDRYAGLLQWQRQPNMGQAATLNRGWRAARGELLGYLSADDVLDPSAVSTVAAWLARDREAVLAYPDYRLLDVHDKVLNTVRAPDFDYLTMLSTWQCPPGPGALFRRSAAEAAGYWDTDLRIVPDYAFWLRLALYGTGRRVPKVLAGFRVHEASQTFRAVPADRSEEYVQVTTSYYLGPRIPEEAQRVRRRAMSSAYLMSAHSHLRSARYRVGLRRVATAVRLYPLSMNPRGVKLLGHALLGHHRFRSRTRTPQEPVAG